MNPQDHEVKKVINALQERVKELNCIYRVEELLQDYDADQKKVLEGIISVIPAGWQYPEICEARIICKGVEFKTLGFVENLWVQSAKIYAKREVVGRIDVCYTKEMPQADEGPFTREERQLIESIADSIGHFIMHQELKQAMMEIKAAQSRPDGENGKGAKIITELLYRTDREMFIRIARKMLNFLYRIGVAEAETLLKQFSLERPVDQTMDLLGNNQPSRRKTRLDPLELSKRTFEIAAQKMSDKEIISRVQQWMQEDKGQLPHQSPERSGRRY